jgi:hypothetical protein
LIFGIFLMDSAAIHVLAHELIRGAGCAASLLTFSFPVNLKNCPEMATDG